MGYGLQGSSYLVVTVISEMSPLTKKEEVSKDTAMGRHIIEKTTKWVLCASIVEYTEGGT